MTCKLEAIPKFTRFEYRKGLEMLIDFDLLTIIIGCIIFLGLAVFIKTKYKKQNIYILFLFIMFVYFLNLAKYTLFPIYIGIELPSNLYQNINLVPFKNVFALPAALNVLMMIPLGFGMPFISHINNKKRIIIMAALSGTIIESIQLIEGFISGGFTIRSIDINDIICNFIGVIIGFALLKVSARLYLKLEKEKLNSFWAYVYDICQAVSVNEQKQRSV